jgi:acylglycerol lipase
MSATVRHETGWLDGAGGVRLFRQVWLPGGEPLAAVVLVHGVSEHSGRYAGVGEGLAACGFALHALDQRGHGRSHGRRAYVDRFRHLVADVDRLVDRVRAAHPGRPVFLLGHSMGGCVALAYALEHQERLAGLALSAPLAALGAAPLPLRVIGRTLSVVAPHVGVYEVDSSAVSRDPEVVRDYDADPLNYHRKLPARTVAELADAVASFPDRLASLTLPLLVMHSPEDRLTPYEGGAMVHEQVSSADRVLRRYDGLAHELLFEPEGDEVLADLADWLTAHSG